MLRENDIDRHQRWSDVKKKIDEKDSRYKAVGDSITREDYFHDYCKMLKDEKKKKVSDTIKHAVFNDLFTRSNTLHSDD